jgi:signal transduction histidine kinase
MLDAFRRLPLTRQFLVASFPILLAGMLVVELVVEREIEHGVVARLGEVQSLYIDGLVAPHIGPLLRGELDPVRRGELDALFAGTPLGQKVVAFILWRPDGRVMYSNRPELVGTTVPIGQGLATALAGGVYSEVLDRTREPHKTALPGWPERLIETYAPVHAEAGGRILGAAEFYQTTDELDAAMRSVRLRTWGVVVATALATYVLLFALVRRASRTIVDQRQELRERVDDLQSLLATNAELDARVRRAAAQTTSLNERFLRRVAADLHDGPAQDLGFAQMRLRSMAEAAPPGSADATVAKADLEAVQAALDTAMADLRSISSGMQLPEIEALSPVEVAARAVRDYERKTGAPVAWSSAGEAPEATLPVKITIYRVLQELLANGFRHAGAAGQYVRMALSRDDVTLEVGDRGPGFDVASAVGRGRGGLVGLRERVHALGGTFDVDSGRGEGTLARVRLPLALSGAGDG